MAAPRKTPAKKTPASKPTAKKTASRAPASARLATAGGFRASVEASLAALNLGPRDAAAAHLARAYAEALDRGRTVADRDARLGDVGPKLLATLGQLGGTPRARKGIEAPPAPPADDQADDTGLADTGTSPEPPPRRNRVREMRTARLQQ